MKRSIIFLLALIVLCALPVLASTPEQDIVLIVDEGDGDFSGLEQVSDEEMEKVVGNCFLTNLENMAGYGNVGKSMTAYGQCMSDATMELIEQAGVTLIFTGVSIVVKDPYGKIISVIGATYSIYKIFDAYKKGLL